jgi:hypothetical protein
MFKMITKSDVAEFIGGVSLALVGLLAFAVVGLSLATSLAHAGAL